MFGGYSIGRLAGVEIKLNVSVLIVAGLVTVTMAFGLFPRALPGLPVIIAVFGGMIAAVLLLFSILWHEMAHVIAAQSYRLPVLSVVLNVFGGVAYLGREPERPEQEFAIAIVGPASSLVLAVGFGVMARLGGMPGLIFAWLAQANFLLALFNLLPGFPLDGGRVARAFLWWRTGSYRTATRLASRLGQLLAALFIIAAGVLLLTGDFSSAVWLFLVALFLYRAASQSARITPAPPTPGKAGTVRRAMRQHVEAVTPSLPLPIMAWKYLDMYKDQAFPVLENGALLGIVTLADAEKIPRLEWGPVKVRDVMQSRDQLFIAAPEDALETVLKQFNESKTDHAPVLDHGVFIGMLNRRDVVVKL